MGEEATGLRFMLNKNGVVSWTPQQGVLTAEQAAVVAIVKGLNELNNRLGNLEQAVGTIARRVNL